VPGRNARALRQPITDKTQGHRRNRRPVADLSALGAPMSPATMAGEISELARSIEDDVCARTGW